LLGGPGNEGIDIKNLILFSKTLVANVF